MSIRVSPSILSADFANLERDIAEVATADWLHVDVMDGHFVPNMTFGLAVVKRIVEVSPLPVDTHLMISNPDRWATAYADAGAQSVTVHWEAASRPVQIARDLRAAGARASIAVNPDTDVAPIVEHIGEWDMVLVMTVQAGFGGQAFRPEMMEKVAAVRAAADATGTWVQVDGGVDQHTARVVAAAGADTLVAGSSIYGHSNRAAAIAAIRAAADGAHV